MQPSLDGNHFMRSSGERVFFFFIISSFFYHDRKKKEFLNDAVHLNPRFLSFRRVSPLSLNFFTYRNGEYTIDIMGLL